MPEMVEAEKSGIGNVGLRYYIGTKRIQAWPQERDGQPGYGVRYADGYCSWSPTTPFEEAYEPLDRMTFGHALEMLKTGHQVARRGWRFAGGLPVAPGELTLSMVPGGGRCWIQLPDRRGKTLEPTPWIGMTLGHMLTPWVPTHLDLMADDWMVVE